MEIFLNKYKDRTSTNKETSVNVDIQRNERLLPYDQAIATVDDYEVYLSEREKADKYRLIFSIKPICSNVLFNAATEIIQNEGSSAPIVLSNTATSSYSRTYQPINAHYSALTRYEAIRDTEYSHPDLGHFVYHCGMDIFNNHLLRRDGFAQIQFMNDEDKAICSPVFNTIEDYARDYSGNIVTEQSLKDTPIQLKDTSGHTYNKSNSMTYNEAYSTNLIEEDGWFGFENPHLLYIPHEVSSETSASTVYLNKVMNNNKGCEFYEMYPDRSLFSFIPKINKYKEGREEYNWKWCLTYPARSTYDYSGKCDIVYNSTEDINGIKVIGFIESETNGKTLLYLRTPIKHNCNIEDKVRVYFITNNGVYDFVECDIEDIGRGNNVDSDYWIAVNASDFNDMLETDENGNILMPREMRIAKMKLGRPCEYYFREFRKIPNISVMNYSVKENEILDDEKISEANNLGTYRSVMGKMGFARSIYNDMIAQLIYNDDIQVKHLSDNKGRPISEIFLTFVKNNKGCATWYTDPANRGNDNVEYSHCFGPVSSGIDIKLSSDEFELFSENDEDLVKDYNVHCIHNVTPGSEMYSIDGKTFIADPNIPASGKKLDEDITIDEEYFLGDIVEWDYSTIQETVLADIQHRFNTYQREYPCVGFDNLRYDELTFDDDDAISGKSGFTLEVRDMGNSINGNFISSLIYPEGYYYKPHYRIQLKEYSDYLDTYYDNRIVYYDATKISDGIYTIKSALPHALNSGDTLILRYSDIAYSGEVIDTPTAYIFTLKITDETLLNYIIEVSDSMLTSDYTLEIYLPNADLPRGVQYIPGSHGAYYYAPFKEFYNSDSTKLQNATFSNGAIYLHEDISLYLRRQDPFAIYGLNYRNLNVYSNGLASLVPSGEELDIEAEEYVEEKDMEKCN